MTLYLTTETTASCYVRDEEGFAVASYAVSNVSTYDALQKAAMMIYNTQSTPVAATIYFADCLACNDGWWFEKWCERILFLVAGVRDEMHGFVNDYIKTIMAPVTMRMWNNGEISLDAIGPIVFVQTRLDNTINMKPSDVAHAVQTVRDGDTFIYLHGYVMHHHSDDLLHAYFEYVRTGFAHEMCGMVMVLNGMVRALYHGTIITRLIDALVRDEERTVIVELLDHILPMTRLGLLIARDHLAMMHTRGGIVSLSFADDLTRLIHRHAPYLDVETVHANSPLPWKVSNWALLCDQACD